MQCIFNSSPNFGMPLSEGERNLLGSGAPALVRPFFNLWRQPQKTPLVTLFDLSEEMSLGGVYLKDEGKRLGQSSFKSLGGGYALMVLLKELLEEKFGREVAQEELLTESARQYAKTVTVCCATDGNHGRSVAAAARLLGCRSVIFIHSGVSAWRAEAIGADEIVRVDGNYDFSVSEAERISSENGWLLISDTSWPGYERIPGLVGQGYTLLIEEALQQMEDCGASYPTHIFLQAGVGGFAASMAGYLVDRLGKSNISTVIVEPERAACIFESSKRRELSAVDPTVPTIMAMLECYQPSLIAWRILEKTSDAFVTITEDDAKIAMRSLANRGADSVIAGESGAAGLAGLMAVSADPIVKRRLGLSPKSKVLLINTESATDPDSYEQIVGRRPSDVSVQA